MVVEVFDHLLAGAFGNADLMLSDELEHFAVVNFFEFAAGSAAHRALFGCLVTFVNIATYGADKFLLHFVVLVVVMISIM